MMKAQNSKKEMTISGHVKELRNRIIICVTFFLLAFAVNMYFAEELLEILLQFGNTKDHSFDYVYLTPQEIILQYISISVVCALIESLPIIIANVILFILPVFERKQKLIMVIYVTIATLLFFCGMVFAYKLIIPYVMIYFATINNSSGIASAVSVASYMSLVKSLIIAFAIIFEIPIVSALLTSCGLLSPERMKQFRPAVVVIIFIIAAIITPPDIISQCGVGIPMVFLYQIGIGVSTLICRRKKRKKECL